MAARPKITARITSLAHAFVHAIIPHHVDAGEQKLLYEQSELRDGECVYCGAPATDGDHFRGLVKNGRPSGYFHTADNIVPACGSCNQSKGGSEWRAWMLGPARGSPTTRRIHDIAARIERLARFESLSRTKVSPVAGLRETVGAEIWDDYWNKLAQIKSDLEAAEQVAALIRSRLDSAFHDSKTLI